MTASRVTAGILQVKFRELITLVIFIFVGLIPWGKLHYIVHVVKYISATVSLRFYNFFIYHSLRKELYVDNTKKAITSLES
jgi:hypothetical protein